MVEDIRDHGAAVDGSTDDTDAINSAVDAAAPDGTVYLPEGDILMGSNSRMPVVLSEDEGGLTIEGAGPAKTNLLMAGGKTDSHFGIYVDPSSGSSISGLRFRNFTLDGQGLEQDYSIGLGIKVTDDGSGPQPVEIRDCVVKDWAVNGIVFEAPGGRVYNSSIVKNGRKREQETGLDGHGLNCDVGDSGTVVADGCLFQDNTGAGADNGSGTLRIRNSVIDRCGYAVKINQDSVEQSVENTLISNIQTEPGIYNIPANTASADLVLNSVVLDTVEMAGVDLPASGSFSGDQIVVKNANQNGSQTAGVMARDEGRSFNIGEMSVHGTVGGAAVRFQNSSGSIDRLVHGGNDAGVGDTGGVNVSSVESGDPLSVSVPSVTDVGAGSSTTEDDGSTADGGSNTYGGYNTPESGTVDWHVPLNENFKDIETDIEDLANRVSNIE